jgi:hypothetical protein
MGKLVAQQTLAHHNRSSPGTSRAYIIKKWTDHDFAVAKRLGLDLNLHLAEQGLDDVPPLTEMVRFVVHRCMPTCNLS